MHPTQLEAALVQVLENYQRCGITRFGSLSAEELPESVRKSLAWLSSSQVPAPPIHPPVAVSTPTERTIRDPALGAAEYPASQAIPAAASSSAGPDRGGSGHATAAEQPSEPWRLPVLTLAQREERFAVLAGEVRDCRQCSAIVGYRQQTVFGDGLLTPTICFVGEAPGADEDRTGKPFVGKAGQLLTKIIQAMKLSRQEVYILNALKCRPPQNRTPLSEEIDHCRHFIESQLEVLQPKFIVCLGAVAVRSILRSDLPIGRLRGRFHQYRSARVVVTYHPSYLLREESAKRLVWDDMKMLLAEL